MKKIILIFILMPVFNLFAQDKHTQDTILYPENIIKLTFANSNRIKSAFYNLESAKSNFKLFESEYTQFNPLIVDSKAISNSNSEKSTEFSTGMKKEFFDGTAISATIGNNSGWGTEAINHNTNFIETEVSFPLFSSARKLDRLIKRTFEENELYTKNLDYVAIVKEDIHSALEQYYDIVPRIKIYNMLKNYRDELKKIISKDSLKMNKNDIEQIEGEISTLNSRITGWEITLFSIQTSMQRYMNLDRINLSQLLVINADFTQKDYFGKYYIEEPIDSIFKKALNNDTEFKVLKIIKNNAEEKKKLAEKGKWDIYATTGGRYNFYDMQNKTKQSNFLSVDVGLKIQLYDNKVLKYTIAKSKSDIQAIEFTIEDRKKQIETDIKILKDGLTKKKEQLISTMESLSSWKKIYESKKILYLSKNESVDNFIQAFRSLMTIEETRYNLENNYFDTIRGFEFICGTYFEYIEMNN